MKPQLSKLTHLKYENGHKWSRMLDLNLKSAGDVIVLATGINHFKPYFSHIRAVPKLRFKLDILK